MDPKLMQDLKANAPAFDKDKDNQSIDPHNLQTAARDVIFKFFQALQTNRDAECGCKMPDDKLIDKLDRELMEPFLKSYPNHSRWILAAMEASNNGEHFPPLKSDKEYELEEQQAQ